MTSYPAAAMTCMVLILLAEGTAWDQVAEEKAAPWSRNRVLPLGGTREPALALR